ATNTKKCQLVTASKKDNIGKTTNKNNTGIYKTTNTPKDDTKYIPDNLPTSRKMTGEMTNINNTSTYETTNTPNDDTNIRQNIHRVTVLANDETTKPQ
ncbi:29200_t:CDS:2, partial [Gigaspora margarita]